MRERRASRLRVGCAVTVFSLLVISCTEAGTSDQGNAVPEMTPVLTETGLDATVGSVAIQADGKVLAGGGFSTPSKSLARYNADGTPDAAFNDTIGDTIDKAVYAVAIQTDGKVLVGGYFSTPSSSLARFNADGTPDAAFNDTIGDTISGGVVSIDVLEDGSILVGGQFTAPSRSIARFNTDGTPDTAFNDTINGQLDLTVAAIAVLDDGSFVAGGAFSRPSRALARFNTDGTPDTAFNDTIDGLISGYVSTIEFHDGKLVVGGQFTTPSNSLARFNADGTPDTAFNDKFQSSGGAALDGYVEKIAVDSIGRIAVGGWFTEPSSWLIWVRPNGELARPEPDPGFDGAVLSVTVVGDSATEGVRTLIVAGAFTSPTAHLVRFDR